DETRAGRTPARGVSLCIYGIIIRNIAAVAQLVERNLAKVEVESSRLFCRSSFAGETGHRFPLLLEPRAFPRLAAGWQSGYAAARAAVGPVPYSLWLAGREADAEMGGMVVQMVGMNPRRIHHPVVGRPGAGRALTPVGGVRIARAEVPGSMPIPAGCVATIAS